MEEETSKTSGDDGVTDHKVPIGPLPLDPVERGKVGTSIELLRGIFVEDGGGGGRIKGHDGGGEEGVRRAIRVIIRVLVASHTSKNRTTLFFPRLLLRSRFNIMRQSSSR